MIKEQPMQCELDETYNRYYKKRYLIAFYGPFDGIDKSDINDYEKVFDDAILEKDISKEKAIEETRKRMESDENKNTTYACLWECSYFEDGDPNYVDHTHKQIIGFYTDGKGNLHSTNF